MRRSLSIFVLVLLLAPLALPLTLAGDAPALPYCCRAGGAHHCSAPANLSLPGDGFRGAASHCPYSHARLLPNSLRPQAPAAVPAPRPAHVQPAALGRSQTTAPVAGSQSPRAPPALSSL
ncbi:MAG TPA: hypothetical protein VE825_12980 [Terriglobales bacterium]|jgi:hypothetical protein|nr:hypothetical protein [Terriglobales bacterium]